MGGVAFLPEELGGAEEHAGTHLPAHDVAPLVAEDGQVAMRGDPVLIGCPDDGFGGGAHDELFLKLGFGIDDDTGAVGVVLETIVGNHGTFLGEAFDVLGLTAEVRLGDKEWEIGVLYTSGLEHIVQGALHLFPNCIAVGLDDHTATYCCLLSEVGIHDQVVVPTRVVVGTLGHLVQFFCHFYYYYCLKLILFFFLSRIIELVNKVRTKRAPE